MFILEVDIVCPQDCWLELNNEQLPSHTSLFFCKSAKEAFDKAVDLISRITVVYYKIDDADSATAFQNSINQASLSLKSGIGYFHQGLQYTVKYRSVIKRHYDLVTT